MQDLNSFYDHFLQINKIVEFFDLFVELILKNFFRFTHEKTLYMQILFL
jgi:hypothetical protein